MSFCQAKCILAQRTHNKGGNTNPPCACANPRHHFLFWKDLFLEGDGEVCFLTNLVLGWTSTPPLLPSASATGQRARPTAGQHPLFLEFKLRFIEE